MNDDVTLNDLIQKNKNIQSDCETMIKVIEENKKNVAKYYRVALFKKFWVNKITGTCLALFLLVTAWNLTSSKLL